MNVLEKHIELYSVHLAIELFLSVFWSFIHQPTGYFFIKSRENYFTDNIYKCLFKAPQMLLYFCEAFLIQSEQDSFSPLLVPV